MRRVRILVGMALTTGGAIWLVDRLDGLANAAAFLARSLPAALVVVGVLHVLDLLRRSRLLAPVVLICAGIGGLVVLHGRVSDLAGPPPFWPLVVVLGGLAIALAERDQRESDEKNIEQAAILRTKTVVRTERPFKVAKVRAVLGDLELDLARCRRLKQDVQVNISVWLGHVKVIVPDTYQVRVASEAFGVHIPTLPPSDGKVAVIEISVLGVGGAVQVQRAWTQPAPKEAEPRDTAITASATALNG